MGTYQNQVAQTSCTPCPTGYTTSGTGKTSCDKCVEGDYYRTSGGACAYRNAPCGAGFYEDPKSANATRVCKKLNPCSTAFKSELVHPSDNARSTAIYIRPRTQYITQYASAFSDWSCWTWQPCYESQYVLQLPVDDDNGFLVKKQVLPLSPPM